MDIKKCDLCKKEIKEREGPMYVRFAYEHADLCTDCASPIYRFFKKNKLLDKDNKKIKES